MADFKGPFCRLISFILLVLLSVCMNDGFCDRGLIVPTNNCTDHLTQYEKQHKIPAGLLHAISKVESGRKDHTGQVVAWPWTVGAEGKSYYFRTKEAAVAAVRKMQLRGTKNIDVGCMQVNLYYHPYAFNTLNDAFEPSKNVAYAAKFLRGLKNEHASWHKAVAHYHSANPEHHIPYRKSVFGIWNKDFKNGDIVLAASIINSVPSETDRPGYVNRIRRLTTGKVITLKQASYTPSDSGAYEPMGVVRRVVRGDTRHIKRVPSAKPRKVSKTLSAL
jgi:hypothetical protein